MNIKVQIKRYGYLKTAYDLLLRFMERTMGGYVFCCLLLPPDRITAPVVSDDIMRYSIGFLEPDQLLKLIRPEEMTMTHSFAEHAYAKGDRCFCIVDGTELVHYSWYSTSPTDVLDGLELRFPGRKVYMYNAFTNIGYRGKKLYPMAVSRAVQSYLGRDCIGAVTMVAANNYSSLVALEQIGFSTIGKFYVVSLGRYYVLSSTGCLRHGVSLVNRLS